MASVDGVEEALGKAAGQVEGHLQHLMPEPSGPEAPVCEAMRYAVFGSAKRLRPFLTLEAAALFGVASPKALRVACAVEILHTYSLVHDDLPSMDDDDLRRGRPSVHKAFDEATAILAGDAMLTLAFEILAAPETHDDARVRADLVLRLAKAAGVAGMVGGQMIDLLAEGEDLELGAIIRLQRLKTGALIAFACEAGAVLGQAGPDAKSALATFAHDLGLAFQIRDDILDVEGTDADLGKTTGKDRLQKKATFVSLLGLERAREQAEHLARQAVAHLDPFDGRADLLRAVPDYVLARRR
ncbi:MAG: polyprenyl synthetase family protein [Pseudomonadota bacterium]